MKKTEDNIFKTYKLKHHANQHKIDLIEDVLVEYRLLANKISNHHWFLFFYDKEKIRDFRDIKQIETKLSERYKQTCQTQVVSTLHSHISNIQNRFVKMVYAVNTPFDEEARIQLLYINKYQKWFHKEATMKNKEINPEVLFLAKKIFKHLSKNKPSFKKYNMILDEKVAITIKKENNEATKFDYWIYISTLEKRKKIYIPIQSNNYFEDKTGVLKKVVQINKKDGKISFSLVKNLSPEIIQYATKKLGIDIGTVNFIATEFGDIIGKKLMKTIKRRDEVIIKLQRNLQKQGVKPNDSERYKRLIKKSREYIKNEVNRLINKLVKLYRPESIHVEDLNFHGSNIGRTNNRILHNFGKGILTKKLESISQLHKIKIENINPAYTSQECPNCRYTDKKNRKTRDLFICQSCGYKCHADVVGARNTSSRSSADFKYTKRRKIFQLLSEEHNIWKEKRCNYSSATTLSRADKKVKIEVECKIC